MKQAKKILFIDPPGWQGAVQGNPAVPNNGIAYLITALRKFDWSISLLDMNNIKYSIEDILSHISTFQPTVIGISCKTATYQAAEKSMHFCNNLEQIPITFEYPYFSAEEIRRACILANIKAKKYELLSNCHKYTILYYWNSMIKIMKYAPECLPEFIIQKFVNIFVKIYLRFR